MPSIDYRLPKRERIHLKRSIDELFATGRSFVSYPLRIVYLVERAEDIDRAMPRCQMMVSVGKKYYKRANRRNRFKRLVREAYRLNKYRLIEPLEREGRVARIAWMCVSADMPDYQTVERAVVKAFARIARQEGLVEEYMHTDQVQGSDTAPLDVLP